MLIIANIVFILFYLQVGPVYLRVSNKPIQITSRVINIGNKWCSTGVHFRTHVISDLHK